MINKLLKNYKRKRNILDLFKLGQRYLENGEYQADDTFNYFETEDISVSEFSRENFENNYSINLDKANFLGIKRIVNLLIKIIYSRKFNVQNNRNGSIKFQGQIFLPFPDLEGYKIFDIKSKKILISYCLKKEYQKKIDTFQYFAPYFKIPEILLLDRNEQLIIEELINKKEESGILSPNYEDVFNKTVINYIHYFNKIKIKMNSKYKKIVLKEVVIKESHRHLIDSLFENIDDALIDTELPIIPLHGDLWLPNILVDQKNKIYYIDWDKSSELIFIYDIYSLIWKEDYYLREYLLGNYNNIMSKIFKIFEVDFNKEYLVDYLYVYIIFYYKERWDSLDEIDLYKNIADFSSRIENFRQNK